jgi:hypothetical protein
MTEEYKCSPTQDYFSPDPGTVEGPVKCGVCGERMNERRNVNGPRGFAMALSGSKELHDVFICPLRTEHWHIQAKKLREEARDTVSGKLAQMFMEEADEIISIRTPTKPDGLWRVF